MLKRVKSVNLRRELPNIIQRKSFEITSLNQQQLYNYGVDSDGKRLTPYKNKYYAREKNYDNPRPGFGIPDLFKTGAFYKGFTVSVSRNYYTSMSIDKKSLQLEKKYGKQIFGLTKDNQRVYLDETLWPEIHRYITSKTGLQFT